MFDNKTSPIEIGEGYSMRHTFKLPPLKMTTVVIIEGYAFEINAMCLLIVQLNVT